MYGHNFIGLKGAKKFNASQTTSHTGSFLALQAMVSSSALILGNGGEASPSAGVGSHISQSAAYTKFTNITWGNNKDSNPNTKEAITSDIVLRAGERIEGPIYAFTMTTGSCIAYLF